MNWNNDRQTYELKGLKLLCYNLIIAPKYMNSLIRMNDSPERTACDISSYQSRRITLQILALHYITHGSASLLHKAVLKSELDSVTGHVLDVSWRFVLFRLGIHIDGLNGVGDSVPRLLYMTASELRFLYPGARGFYTVINTLASVLGPLISSVPLRVFTSSFLSPSSSFSALTAR
jgi:hypothetical protein